MDAGIASGRILAVVVRPCTARWDFAHIDAALVEHPIGSVDSYRRNEYALEQVDTLLRTAREKGVADVIFDMSGVTWVNSTGLGVLVSVYERIVRGGGRMIMCGASERVDNILTVTQLKRIFLTFGSIAEGLEFLARCEAGEATWPDPRPAPHAAAPSRKTPSSPPPRRATAREIAPILARALVYATVFGGLVLGFVPLRLLRWTGLSRPATGGVGPATGELVAIAGAALAIWCVHAFVVAGRGTPAPFDPPRRLVTSGPYALARNPMYIGAALVLAGVALACRSLPLAGYTVVFVVLAHLFVTRYEEPRLRALFGDDYAAYCARVKRWRWGFRAMPARRRKPA